MPKNNIYMLRRKLGLTQKALGNSIGRSESYIAKIEVGVLKPAEETLNVLYHHLQVPPGIDLLRTMDRRQRP